LSTRLNHSLSLRADGGYWQISQQPLQGLLFLVPLLVLYELGASFYPPTTTSGLQADVSARLWLSRFFDIFGVTGVHLPGIIVVVVLLSLHLFSKHKWRFEPKVYALMWVESLALAFPLFVFLLVVARRPLLAQAVSAMAPGPQTYSLQTQLILSVGAGIYEELVFRLIGIALLHLILHDVLALPKEWSASLAIILSSLAFAAYHFSDANPFTVSKLTQYTLAGIYLAVIYQMRGFGIVAATHALYDVLMGIAIWRASGHV
jgi:membrane protease YdiL (CAAX protease family)